MGGCGNKGSVKVAENPPTMIVKKQKQIKCDEFNEEISFNEDEGKIDFVRRSQSKTIDKIPSKNDFKTGKKIGEGVYSKVYNGLSPSGEIVAIKIIDLKKAFNITGGINELNLALKISKIKKAVETLKTLSHPNVIEFFYTEDYLNEDKLELTIIYKFCNEAIKVIKNFGMFDEKVVKIYTKQILGCLKYLNSNNIEHNNLKLSNILIEGGGTIFISDILIDDLLLGDTIDDRIESLKRFGKRPIWIAPELVNKKAKVVFGKSDVWSLGCLIIEMLNKDFLYSNIEFNNNGEFLKYLRNINSTPDIPDKVSKSCILFISNCLTINPEERPSVDWLLEHEFLSTEVLLNKEQSNLTNFNQTSNAINNINVNSHLNIIINNSSNLNPSQQQFTFNEAKKESNAQNKNNFLFDGKSQLNSNDQDKQIIENTEDFKKEMKDEFNINENKGILKTKNSKNSSYIDDDYDIYEVNSDIENSYQLINNNPNYSNYSLINNNNKSSFIQETICKSIDSNNLVIVNNKNNRFGNYNFLDFLKNNQTTNRNQIEKIEEEMDNADLENDEDRKHIIESRSKEPSHKDVISLKKDSMLNFNRSVRIGNNIHNNFTTSVVKLKENLNQGRVRTAKQSFNNSYLNNRYKDDDIENDFDDFDNNNNLENDNLYFVKNNSEENNGDDNIFETKDDLNALTNIRKSTKKSNKNKNTNNSDNNLKINNVLDLNKELLITNEEMNYDDLIPHNKNKQIDNTSYININLDNKETERNNISKDTINDISIIRPNIIYTEENTNALKQQKRVNITNNADKSKHSITISNINQNINDETNNNQNNSLISVILVNNNKSSNNVIITNNKDLKNKIRPSSKSLNVTYVSNNDKKSVTKSREDILKSMRNEGFIQTIDNNTAIYQSINNTISNQNNNDRSKPPKPSKILIIKKKSGNTKKHLDIENIKKKIEDGKIFSSKEVINTSQI